MKNIVLTVASFYGLMSVILGAFGAHAFKKILSVEKLSSFEVGVRYQMYHAIALLAIGCFFNFSNGMERSAAWLIMIGTFIFSVSIYFLSFSEYWSVNLKFLGPITPIGGMLMLIGWGILVFYFAKTKFN